MNNQVNIKAIHDIDLEETLKNLGLLSKIERKQVKCKFCKKIVNLQDVYALYPESGDIKIVCSDTNCVKQLLTLIREDKIEV